MTTSVLEASRLVGVGMVQPLIGRSGALLGQPLTALTLARHGHLYEDDLNTCPATADHCARTGS
jgi:hypothetical protein